MLSMYGREGWQEGDARQYLDQHRRLHTKDLHELLRPLEDDVQTVQLLSHTGLFVSFRCVDCSCGPETSVVMVRGLLFEAVVPVPEGFYELVGNVRKVAWEATNALHSPSLLADGVTLLYGASTR